MNRSELAEVVPGLGYVVDGAGIATVVFDRPGEKVNLLTPEILRGLGRLMDEFRGREDVEGVLFSSAKPGMFIAGMDVEVIARVTDAHEAAEGARLGQSVFQKIADLGKPSACAINGVCLGGGTEMALACSFRFAADDPSVQIGLPEVQLGIIPGFGGTQRLPRRVGLTTSLDLILTGRRLDARRARRAGLVDEVIPKEYLERESRRFLSEAAAEGQPHLLRKLRRPRPLTARVVEAFGPLRRFVLAQARKRTAAKVNPSQYPAPFRALEAVEAAFSLPLPQGLDLEARLVGELVTTRTSKNLIWLFKTQTALKNEAPGLEAGPREVRKVAVLGAGIMGGGISQLVAEKDILVRLKDIRYDAILHALETAWKVWQQRIRRRRMSETEALKKIANIAPTLDYTGFRRVDLVLEAVVEDLGVKRRVLSDVEGVTGDDVIFASNTSSLPITEISAQAARPAQVVGLHFFNPVHRMPLVEVIAGEQSSREALATVYRFAVKLGKTPVIVRDSPGFLVNRILMLYLNEAMLLLGEGVPMDAADRAMRRFGMPMGPFELLDQVGLDTANHVARVLMEAFGRRIGAASPVLGAMVAAGRLGKKNGKGFYQYKNGKKGAPDSAAYEIAGVKPAREVPEETLQERMVLAMVNEAAVCLQDGIVREPREVDIAMVMGTGFPPFRGGLLRHADEIGIAVVVDRLSRLADAHGERFRPAELLRTMVREERRFYPAPEASALPHR